MTIKTFIESWPILYSFKIWIASDEWPISLKPAVASFPAYSSTNSSPPGCYMQVRMQWICCNDYSSMNFSSQYLFHIIRDIINNIFNNNPKSSVWFSIVTGDFLKRIPCGWHYIIISAITHNSAPWRILNLLNQAINNL